MTHCLILGLFVVAGASAADFSGKVRFGELPIPGAIVTLRLKMATSDPPSPMSAAATRLPN